MRLRKGVEDGCHFVVGNPDARISHRESDGAGCLAVRIVGDGHDHRSLLRELDRVSQQVEQNLVEAVGITDEVARHIVRQVTDQFEAFFVGAERQHLARFVDEFREVEVYAIEIEPAGFNF